MPTKRATKPAGKSARRQKPLTKKPARKARPAAGPPPPPEDAVEVSGVWGKVLYSETDPYAEVREIFNHYDRDHSGRIDAREFARICDGLGLELEEDELTAGVAAVDADGDGQISWDDFLGWWRSMGR